VSGAGRLDATMRAVVETVVPEAAALDAAGWDEVAAIIAAAVAARPRPQRRQIALFVRLLGASAVFRHGRTFAGLDAAHRTRHLSRLERSAILLVRRGTWGVRTLALMGFYARPAAAAAIGYSPSPAGWRARHADPTGAGERR
jgi:hypothetical protein